MTFYRIRSAMHFPSGGIVHVTKRRKILPSAPASRSEPVAGSLPEVRHLRSRLSLQGPVSLQNLTVTIRAYIFFLFGGHHAGKLGARHAFLETSPPVSSRTDPSLFQQSLSKEEGEGEGP